MREQIANVAVVLDQQNGFASALRAAWFSGCSVGRLRLLSEGQRQGEDGANAFSRFNRNAAACLANNPIGRGESKSGAFTLFLRGKERLKKPFSYLDWHAAACVLHADQHIRA